MGYIFERISYSFARHGYEEPLLPFDDFDIVYHELVVERDGSNRFPSCESSRQ